jgi:hypothetical protein
MKWAKHAARKGEMRDVYIILVGKPERTDHSEYRGVDGRIILKWVLGELGWEHMEWIHLAQDTAQWRAVVNTVVNFQVQLAS